MCPDAWPRFANVVSLTLRPRDCYRRRHVKNSKLLVLVALAGPLAVACRDEPTSRPRAEEAPSSQASSSRAAEARPDGPIATVNGQPVSRERFERELAQSQARYEQTRKELQPELLDNLRRALVRRLVEAEVVRQKAAEWNVAPSSSELDAMWTKHRERFGTSDAFQAFLERAGTTEADLKNQLVDSLLLDRVEQRVDERLEISPDKLRAYYETRTQHFEQPEEVRVAQILVQVPSGATDAEREEARARAASALKQIRDGADFATVAGRVSDGPARSRGGDLGFLPRGRLMPGVDEAAFALKPGQVSDVLESRFGFHVIRVIDHRPQRTLTFEEARPAIERRMRGQMLRKALHAQLEAWKREMDIELFEDTELFTRSPSARGVPNADSLSPGSLEQLEMEGGGMEPIEVPAFPGGAPQLNLPPVED